jgi:hypothetical protein
LARRRFQGTPQSQHSCELHFDFGPKVIQTASAKAVAPLSAFPRASDLNKSRFPAMAISWRFPANFPVTFLSTIL